MSSREIDLAWLAGLLEGDGNFQIQKIGKNFQYRVSISQSVKDIQNLDEVEQILKRLGIPYRRYRFTNRKYPQEAIYVNRRAETHRLLKMLLSYMRGRKKTQVELMISALEDSTLDVEAIRKRMSRLKIRGYIGKRGGRLPYKIKQEDWPEIVKLAKTESLNQIAKRFGVTKQAIWYLLRVKKIGDISTNR